MWGYGWNHPQPINNTFQFISVKFRVDPGFVIFSKFRQFPDNMFVVIVEQVFITCILANKRRLVIVPIGPIGVITPWARPISTCSASTDLTLTGGSLCTVLVRQVWVSLSTWGTRGQKKGQNKEIDEITIWSTKVLRWRGTLLALIEQWCAKMANQNENNGTTSLEFTTATNTAATRARKHQSRKLI